MYNLVKCGEYTTGNTAVIINHNCWSKCVNSIIPVHCSVFSWCLSKSGSWMLSNASAAQIYIVYNPPSKDLLSVSS